MNGSPLPGPFPVDGQRRAVRAILERLGFDDESWLLADSAHPFSSTIGQGDNRITTRYDEATLDSVLGAVHEFGHGLYEAQIAPELARTPLAHGCSMAVHESQSRFWEVFVCGQPSFWRGAWQSLADPLDGALDRVEPPANSRLIADRIPSSLLKLYPGAGHAFMYQYPALVSKNIGAFLG